MKNQIRIELTESGKSRKADMLADVQNSMIHFHRSKRQKRKRFLIAASVCIPVMAIGTWINAVNNSESGSNSLAGKTINKVDNDEVASKTKKIGFEVSANQNTGETLLPTNSSLNSKPASRYNQFVVEDIHVQPREMEQIDDDQMLKLLKQAGVDAWLAEIDDERIVLTQSGKRL